MRVLLAVLVAASAVSGCAYQVKPISAPAVNIYTTYDDRIPGRWAVVVADTSMLDKVIDPSSYECSAHKYPFNAGSTIRTSVEQTMQQVFEEVESAVNVPSSDTMMESGNNGYVLVRVSGFQPRLVCNSKFFSMSCTGTSELAMTVDVVGLDGRKLLSTSVGGTATADGNAGGACGQAAEVVAEAYRRSLKETLERMAERISNSRRIRGIDE